MSGAPTAPLRLRAPAKLNLGLEIVGRRADGYHELVTIFQTIALYDTLAIAPAPALTLRAPDELGGEDNLVLRAARLLAGAAPGDGAARGAALTLDKAIPVAAGLGGGSSDAAAALRGLDRLWRLALPDDALAALAVRLGADVPFFLRGGAALATGIGEELTPLPTPSPTWFVTLTPRLALPADKTRRLYAALTPADFGDGARTRAQAARLRRGEPLDPALLVNGFAGPLARLFPELAEWRRRFARAGAAWTRFSGSGPTLFTIVPSEGEGRRVAAALGAGAATVHLVAATTPPASPAGR